MKALALTALLLSGLIVGPQDAVTFRYRPKVGDKEVYTSKIVADFGGESSEIEAETRNEILAVDEKSYRQITVTTTKIDGESSETTEKSSYLLDGRTIKDPDEEEVDEGNILFQFVEPEKPVAPGESWIVKEKLPEQTGLPTYELTFTYVGPEKIGDRDCLKVTTKGRMEAEPPGKVESTTWLDAKTFQPVKSEGEIEAVNAEGPNVRLRFTIELKG